MLTRTGSVGWKPVTGRLAACAVVILAGLLAVGCVQVQAGDGNFGMGGDIFVPEGEVARDDIVSIGGNVRIDGEVRRDVVVIGGQLVINGEVGGSVTSIGGGLILGPGARIDRDAVVVGGYLDRDDSARIGGEFVNVSFGFGFGDMFGRPSFGPVGWGWWGFTPFAWIFRTTQLFYWLLLALITVALVGDRVSSASHAISREPLRLGAIGVVAIFAVCFAFLFLLILSVLIIGIPFLLALILFVPLAYIFGVVAVFQSVGNRVMNMVGRPEASQIAIVLSGTLVLGILRYVPFGFGGLIWFVAGLVGFGAVFATRFGTGRPWIYRAAAPPPPPPGEPPAAAPAGGQAPTDPHASAPTEAAAPMSEFDHDDEAADGEGEKD